MIQKMFKHMGRMAMIEISIMIFFSAGIAYGLHVCTPVPPEGICDGDSTVETCTEWWNDLMERP